MLAVFLQKADVVTIEVKDAVKKVDTISRKVVLMSTEGRV